MSDSVRETAIAAVEAGLCVLPVTTDGAKKPALASWTRYQEVASTLAEVECWFADDEATGLALVTGAVSGNLELFEFDDGDLIDPFLARAAEAGIKEIVERIMAGYREATPDGGQHWLYFLAGGGAKSTPIARRPATDRHGRPIAKPLIETKGEGGYVIIAPSHGGVHETGRPYRLLAGGFGSIATLTAAERDALWALARTFDELPKRPARVPVLREPGDHPGWIVRPGDAFAAQVSWEDILVPHGWEPVRQQGEATLWQRPGGYPGGWGASTNYAGSDLLYVWTTAAPPLDPNQAYGKFAAFTYLNHDGDFRAAAQALVAQGYGEAASGPAPTTLAVGPSPLGQLVLQAEAVPVPPFPLDAFPPIARAFIAAEAEALGCPPEFVALPLLVFCGAVAGNSRRLRIKPGFEVLPIVWGGVIGRPGTVKSPALNRSRQLLDVLQQEAWDHYREQLEAWTEQPATERGSKPLPEHFFATDTTTQAVAAALVSSRGLAIIHDELAGWVHSFDAFAKGGDRQYWLSSWSAHPLKPNRKTGEPLYIPEPVVGITGGIQPEMLGDLAGEARRDDGFLPRFWLVWPDAAPALWSDAVVPPEVTASMLDLVRKLRLPGEHVVISTLSPEAYAAWIAWYNENQRTLPTLTGIAAGWAAKAGTHLARAVILLHMLTDPDDHTQPVDLATLQDGIVLVEYLRAHLPRILPMFGAVPPTTGAGLGLRIDRILQQAAPAWVARAELAIRLGGHAASHVIDTHLDDRQAAGLAEQRTVQTGGRPRTEWRWCGDGAPSNVHTASGAASRSSVETWKRGKAERDDPDLLSTAFHVSTHQADFFDEPQPDDTDGWEHWEVPE